MALATTTLIDGTTQPRQTGIALRVVGPGPGFEVSIERSPNGSTSWVERARQTFPDGAGGVFIDPLPVTATTYYYRARAVAPGYQPSAYTAVVQGQAGDLEGLLKTLSAPLTESETRLWGALDGPTTLNTGVRQDDGANTRTIVKGRQVFLARHKDVLTFAPAFQTVPKFRILGGATYIPESVWTTADEYRELKASITSGTATLTATEGTFKSGDAGKAIKVAGAGSGGATLTTTILSYTNSTTVTLNTNALTTVASAFTQIYSGSLLAPQSTAQIDDSTLLGLSVSGATVQARLRQKNTSTTPRSVSWSAGTITTLTNLDVDLGANMPAYDDKYTVTFEVQVWAIVNTKFTPTYCEVQLTLEVQTNDGGGWVTRGTYFYGAAAEGLGNTDHQTFNESYQYTVAGLGTNDDVRIVATAFTIDGNDGGSHFQIDPGQVNWLQGTNNDQYANRTPAPADYVTVEVEAA